MLETERNNLDQQERRHIWSGEFLPHHTTGSLVQDPGITDEEKIVFISGFQRISGQEETKRILVGKKDGVTEHTEMLTALHTSCVIQRSIQGDWSWLFSTSRMPSVKLITTWSEQLWPSIMFQTRLFNSSTAYIIQRSINIRLHQQQENKEHISEQGVLQGDPSSPLLFNLCFNTLMLRLHWTNLSWTN